MTRRERRIARVLRRARELGVLLADPETQAAFVEREALHDLAGAVQRITVEVARIQLAFRRRETEAREQRDSDEHR